MPIEFTKYLSTPTSGDVGSVALDAAVGMRAAIDALKKLQANPHADLSLELSEMEKTRANLFKQFVNLAGWTPDDDG